MTYVPSRIEPKWQAYWEEHEVFRAEADPASPKYYVLDMFPYPSGAGLHVGHPVGYTATDVVARYKRMRGFNVLHPMGWDAYGLPAERYAIRTGVHPAITTRKNIDTFRRQVKRLGFSYDWSRELSTTDPAYMRWTQWIFLKLFERGLAYQAEVAVNWCPAQGTVLANEEVKDGRYVETGDPVERRLMRQWMLRITDYADRLLDDLEALDWPEGVKAMQRNWIGRSEGAEISFAVEGHGAELVVFSTRPETIYGATFCALAPEHALAGAIVTPAQRPAVDDFLARMARLSEVERAELAGGGVFTGAHALHPLTGARLPVWIADYVLTGYGTGAIMAVPAHDARDHAFARRHGLEVRPVVQTPADWPADTAYEGDGLMINSAELDGLGVAAARAAAIGSLAARSVGRPRTTYRLRDWLFSRQRYWGEPIPVLHRADGRVAALPEDALPLLPPELQDFRPTESGLPPLSRDRQWVEAADPADGATALRETSTMPQWAGSCWYYLRFIDPRNDDRIVDAAKERYWMPVDLYVGGAEHAVLHLLYARFWHKVLYDIGVVSTPEPFARLFNQGMILAHSYRDAAGRYYEAGEVEAADGRFLHGSTEVIQQVEKMSKSRLNVVNPDDVVDAYGADAMRVYEMFMGPLDAAKPWQTSGVAGVRRFLNRAWRLVADDDGRPSGLLTGGAALPELERLRHATVMAVTADIEALRFNTAVARLMELCNALTAAPERPREAVEAFVLLLAPFAPHLAEELWAILGHEPSISYAAWPSFDPARAEAELSEYVIQLNGKVRHRMLAPSDLLADDLIAAAKRDARVQELLAGQAILREVAVRGRLVNFVVKTRAPG